MPPHRQQTDLALEFAAGPLHVERGDDEVGLGVMEVVKKADQVRLDTERDKFMGAQEALDYGLIDRIITKAPSQK